jgi:hypothetical protein
LTDVALTQRTDADEIDRLARPDDTP